MAVVKSDKLGLYAIGNDGSMLYGSKFAHFFHRLELVRGDYLPSEGPYDYGIAARIANAVGGRWVVVKQPERAEAEMEIVH